MSLSYNIPGIEDGCVGTAGSKLYSSHACKADKGAAVWSNKILLNTTFQSICVNGLVQVEHEF